MSGETKGDDESYDLSKILKEGSNALKQIKQKVQEDQSEELSKQLLEEEDEQMAKKLQNELESEELARALAEDGKLEDDDYAVAKMLEVEMGLSEKLDVDTDEQIAMEQQQLWDYLQGQEAKDYKVAWEADMKDRAESNKRERDDRLYAEIVAQGLEKEGDDEGKISSAQEVKNDDFNENMVIAAMREEEMLLAKERIYLDLPEEAKNSSEEESVTREVMLWKKPIQDYVHVEDHALISVYLPQLTKLRVPIDDSNTGIVIAAEREPIHYSEGLNLDPSLSTENPIVCQAMLKISVPSAQQLTPDDIHYEYNSDFGIVYVFIKDVVTSTLSGQEKKAFMQKVEAGAKRFFNFSGFGNRGGKSKA